MARKPSALPSDNICVFVYDQVVGDPSDGQMFSGTMLGGNDSFYGEDCVPGYAALGDEVDLTQNSSGGKDYFVGGDGVGDPEGALLGLFYGEDLGELPAVVFGGDALDMWDSSNGGADEMHGGTNSTTILAGDALEGMHGNSKGGNDLMYGGDAWNNDSLEGGVNLMVGDALVFGDFYGFAPNTPISSDYEARSVRGGADHMYGGNAYADCGSDGYAINVVAGDAAIMTGTGSGGADQITGGDAHGTTDGYAISINALVGDGLLMVEGAKSGNDVIEGGNACGDCDGDGYAINIMAGDALFMTDAAVAGNDVLYGGNASASYGGEAEVLNAIVGDALIADGAVKFGADKIYGGEGECYGTEVLNVLVGDVGGSLDALGSLLGGISLPLISGAAPDGLDIESMFGDTLQIHALDASGSMRLGNDTLTGGDYAENILVGDGYAMGPGMRGGNDKLVAGGTDSENMMYGDGVIMFEGAKAGNDTLIGGSSCDQMWGDADSMEGAGGSDRFVMSVDGGFDTIWDFHASEKDRLDLSAFSDVDPDFANFKALMASGRIEASSDKVATLDAGAPVCGVVIDLSTDCNEAQVFLAGVTLDQINARLFIF
ncbi:MAG TPA: hypothetical protein VHA82_05510 [Ramlibacter sp.]|uniref:hypothetical protein n=1 Tax=Ramlibacter sp. TaxID=1917967 RepID=UPI002BD141F8|nr:hypothetical protein [Ramlibacter sp.]HVZ43248.1 hypothetical protein [Ramlibacter sp.]